MNGENHHMQPLDNFVAQTNIEPTVRSPLFRGLGVRHHHVCMEGLSLQALGQVISWAASYGRADYLCSMFFGGVVMLSAVAGAEVCAHTKRPEYGMPKLAQTGMSNQRTGLGIHAQ